MAKRESAEVKILRLFDSLSTEGKRIVFELIKSARVVPKLPAPSVARKSSTKSGAKDATANGRKKGGAGNVPSELARVLAREWNATPEHVQIALNEAQGDEPTALQLLTARGQVKEKSQ